MIKKIYFAIPEKLNKDDIIKEIPERAGIILIYKTGHVHIIKEPIVNEAAKKWTDEEKYKFARLGALRIWGLKSTILNLQKTCNSLTKEVFG